MSRSSFSCSAVDGPAELAARRWAEALVVLVLVFVEFCEVPALCAISMLQQSSHMSKLRTNALIPSSSTFIKNSQIRAGTQKLLSTIMLPRLQRESIATRNMG